jgi:phosphoribosyl 1,2-cyclic phosphodiesterase
MRVTFYGVRGSVPTPGPSTVRYGGNSACVEVRLTDGSLVILDGGTGIRELGKRLIQEGLTNRLHLLITHPHWDHIIGLPFFGPLYLKQTKLTLYTFGQRWIGRGSHPDIFDSEHFPVSFAELPFDFDMIGPRSDEVWIGSARVRRIRLNHPGGSDGFRIDDADGASLCYLTDNELFPPTQPTTSPSELAQFASGAGLLIHDAQYLPSDMPLKKGWGHSLVQEVLDLGRQADVKSLALFHHEPERDDDALDRIGLDARRWAHEHAPDLQPFVAREGLSVELTRTGQSWLSQPQ